MIVGDLISKNINPLEYILSILEGKSSPPRQYIEASKRAQLSWRAFGRKPVTQELLKLLTRFELITEQVKRISDPGERKNSGINQEETDLYANPYIISELDLGSSTSLPILVERIDRGTVPGGNSALFILPEEIFLKDDTRRVRGITVAAIKGAPETGETIFSIDDLLQMVRKYYPDNRACRPDRDMFNAEIDFYKERLWIDENRNPPLAALGYIRDLELLISSTVQNRLKRIDHSSGCNGP